MKSSVAGGFGGQAASIQENERLRQIVFQLEQRLRTQDSERARLRSTVSTAIEMDVRQNVDSSDVIRLQEHIRRVRAENENLRRVASRGQFTNNRVQIGSRIVKTDVRREASSIGRSISVPMIRNSATALGIRPAIGSTIMRPSAGYTSNVIGGATRLSGGYSTSTFGSTNISEADLLKNFMMYDKDRSGNISFNELKIVYAQFGLQVSDS